MKQFNLQLVYKNAKFGEVIMVVAKDHDSAVDYAFSIADREAFRYNLDRESFEVYDLDHPRHQILFSDVDDHVREDGIECFMGDDYPLEIETDFLTEEF